MSDEADHYRRAIARFIAETEHRGEGGQSPWDWRHKFKLVLEEGERLRGEVPTRVGTFEPGLANAALDARLRERAKPIGELAFQEQTFPMLKPQR